MGTAGSVIVHSRTFSYVPLMAVIQKCLAVLSSQPAHSPIPANGCQKRQQIAKSINSRSFSSESLMAITYKRPAGLAAAAQWACRDRRTWTRGGPGHCDWSTTISIVRNWAVRSGGLLRMAKRIGTHDGKFHADEAFACALLRMTRAFADAGTDGRPSSRPLPPSTRAIYGNGPPRT